MRVAFGLENLRLLDSFRLKDLALLDALGFEDGRAFVPFGLHLPRHRLGDVHRRIDLLHLDARDFHAPGVGGLIEHLAEVGVNDVAGDQRLVEGPIANQVAQVGLGQRGAGVAEILHLEFGTHRVDHLVVDDSVYGYGHIVLGDHFLRIHIDDLLAHINADQLVHKGHQEVQTGSHHGVVLAQPHDQALLILGHDPRRLGEGH